MPSTLRVEFSEKFKVSFENLSSRIREKAVKKMAIFVSNPYHPSLETHKLHGKYRENWSYSVDNSYRIIFYIFR